MGTWCLQGPWETDTKGIQLWTTNHIQDSFMDNSICYTVMRILQPCRYTQGKSYILMVWHRSPVVEFDSVFKSQHGRNNHQSSFEVLLWYPHSPCLSGVSHCWHLHDFPNVYWKLRALWSLWGLVELWPLEITVLSSFNVSFDVFKFLYWTLRIGKCNSTCN